MKQGRALSEVLTELQRQNAAKQDFIGPAQAFTLRPDGSTFEIIHKSTKSSRSWWSSEEDGVEKNSSVNKDEKLIGKNW